MMQKTLRTVFSVLLMSVVFFRCAVASSGIAVTFLDYRLDSTQNVSLGYTLTINAQVRNTDTAQPFSGVLDFGLRNNGNVLTTTSIFDKPPYSGNSLFLDPGETVPAIFSVDIDDPYFAPGPDVVVVWPISSSPIADSILINLLIQDPSGIVKTQDKDFTYTVTPGQIHLFYSESELNFKQVRIFNILGQSMASFNSNLIHEVPIPALPRGIYLCELVTADQKTRVIKFLHL